MTSGWRGTVVSELYMILSHLFHIFACYTHQAQTKAQTTPRNRCLFKDSQRTSSLPHMYSIDRAISID
jgi:hypothetical protein